MADGSRHFYSFIEGQGALLQSFCQGLAINVFHNDGMVAIRMLHSIDAGDVGVFQRGE